MDTPRTLLEAIRYFSDPLNCFHYMVQRRWPTGEITCPTCGSGHLRFDRKRLVWTCNIKHSRRQFSIKVGTIFEDSPLSLSKWLPTVWMVANMKNGGSSHEVGRSLGVTQKTAWFMLHRIRLAMREMGGGMMSGEVEVDETYVGGKLRNMHRARQLKMKGSRWTGKVAVMGLLERHPDRGSVIRTQIIPGTKWGTLTGVMRANITEGSEVFTDALPSYASLNHLFIHRFIDHQEAYVMGRVHTNGLENFWSLLKRTIHGTYVNVEPFHLFRYLDEQVCRFNERKLSDATRFESVIDRVVNRRLTYAELTGAGKAPKN